VSITFLRSAVFAIFAIFSPKHVRDFARVGTAALGCRF